MSTLIYLLISLAIVALNAFFVAAEIAMLKIRSTRLETLKEEGHFLARQAFSLISDLNISLTVCQIGVTSTSLALGWLGEPAFYHLIEPIFSSFPLSTAALHGLSLVFSFLVLTLLHLVIGEMLPKQLALQSAEKIILNSAIPIKICYYLFYPLIGLLNRSTNFFVKLLGLKPNLENEKHSEEEIRLIVEESMEEGTLSSQKASLIENVFDFEEQTVRHVMIPRQEIISLSLGKSSTENLSIAKESGHTRFPLCEGDLDHVIGLVNIKDVIWQLEDQDNLINIYDLKRSILFVPEGKPVSELLKEFQAKKIHMAVVIDEFGNTAGLVTLEDVIEELVGEIQDEFDQELPKILKKEEGVFWVDGATGLKELDDELNLILDAEDNSVSIGGYVVNQLGRLAKEGDELVIEPYLARVIEVDDKRITRLAFNLLPKSK